MFSRCIRCNKPFPKNSEIDELPLGRRMAFDTAKGRLWVVCTHCEQWNLVPLEERWEAVEQCERLAASAEATATGSKLGIAQTSSGLELLRVGGLSQTDIANWRYGRSSPFAADARGGFQQRTPLICLPSCCPNSMGRSVRRPLCERRWRKHRERSMRRARTRSPSAENSGITNHTRTRSLSFCDRVSDWYARRLFSAQSIASRGSTRARDGRERGSRTTGPGRRRGIRG